MESEFVRHEPCPNCSSSDAFSIYSDGHGFCFSCDHYKHADGGEQPMTQTESKPVYYNGDFAAIRSRKITEETCKKFNVRVDTTDHGPVVRFPYYSDSGRVVAYKERDKEKNFHMIGKNEDKYLFGQKHFGSGKTIVITEGEFDALAVFQARPNWAVVSVPTGAKGAKKALSSQLNYLLGFDEIVLMFDNDDAGVSAAEECTSLFPPDRIFLASLDKYKDACEALQAGDGEAIRQSIWNKRSYCPKSIIDGRTLFDLVAAPLHGRDASYGYPGLDSVAGGLRLGELVTVTAGSGTGKSTFCGELAVSLIDQGFNVGYIALEESVKRTGLRLMTVKANKPLHIDNQIEDKAFREAFDATLGSGKVFLRDGFGSIDPDVILNDIRFLVKANDCKFVILDHLSILLSGNENHDERKTIDIVMTKLRSFVEETGIGLILISHLRRNQGDKGHEDGARVSMSQLRGSHSIAQLSDLVVALQRDISSGDNQAEIVVLKNRFNGKTGPACFVSYGQETGRMVETAESPKNLDFTPTDYGDF